jgi:DNA (cytosine-5)-methyltransferase 1
MELINAETLSRYRPDVVCAGTPCQTFSIAGLRAGLDDPRGNLTLVFLRHLERLRPSWMVWENVPGVLSCDKGRAFGAFLGGLGKLGYGFAYRILDAQHFGIPQRRRRVFVVGHLGDWRPAAAAIFERSCLSGDSPPIRKEGQKVAGTLAARTRGGGGLGTDFECDGGLVASTEETSHCLNAGGMGRQDLETETMIPIPSRGVRKLTPKECERLQGFPDDWTLVPYIGRKSIDRLRYRAIGNSMAVPVMRWIGARIAAVNEIILQDQEMAA